MPRYELDGQFWAIARAGTTLEITTGAVGERGVTKPRKFVTEAHADKQYALLIADKLTAGYVEVEPPPPPNARADNPLEAAILADPYDADAWAVYADWLASRGDPRGDLAQLQIAADQAPRDRALRTEIERHFKKHADVLLGPLADYHGDDHRGVLGWRHGFIHRVAIDARRLDARAELVLDTVLEHPSGRFLAELELVDDDPDLAGEALDLLAAKPPATLRSLELGSPHDLIELDSIATYAPRLQRFALRGRHQAGTTLSRRCLSSLTNLAWPELTHFELVRARGDAGIADLAPLFRRAPKLAYLRVRGMGFASAVCRALLASPLPEQLVVLDLALADMTDVAPLLVEHRARFAALEELAFTRLETPPIERLALDGLGVRVVDVVREPIDPDDGDDDRYDNIRE